MRTLLICLFTSYHFSAAAQNLFPNPSFEEQNICAEYGEACSPMGWRSTVLKNFLYPRFEGRPERVPKAADGYRYISFYLFNPLNQTDRRFVQTPLLCPLQAGETYQFAVSIMLGEAAVSVLEFRFVDSLEIQEDTKPQIGQTADMTLYFSEELPHREWIRAEAIYTARGGERGIVIGLFQEQVNVLKIKPMKRKEWNELESKRIYIAIDSVSLHPQNPLAHADCPWQENLERTRRDASRHTMHTPVLSKEKTELNIIIETLEFSPPSSEEEPGEELQWVTKVRFDFNSSELREDALKELFQLLLRMHDDKALLLEIDAHTDSRGDDDYNQRLSEARAKAVADFFLQRRINNDRIRIQAHGKRQIRSLEDAENRRAELRVFRRL
jgi:outer membrane protein OmpA-like peptidoglycan-associated protein